jgi:hypothetical protein
MSDRFAAQITIGGDVPRSLVEGLCNEISASGGSRDWGETSCEPSSAEELLASRGEDGTITLYDSEARYGEFPELESFLTAHGIPFDRTSEAKWEYDGEIVKFRPGHELYHLLATQDGETSITSEEIEEIAKRLDDVEGLSKRALLDLVVQVRDDLRSVMAMDVPPVPPLVIVEG